MRYNIHDNGGTPFYVDVIKNTVTVWKNMDTFVIKNGKFIDIKKDPKQLFTSKVLKVFLGKSSLGAKGSTTFEKGNSILLQLTTTRYMFIGMLIYEFEVPQGETVIEYYSDIGNNDYPYPFAVTSSHAYLMIEKVAVSLAVLDKKKDIYGQYYGHNVDTDTHKVIIANSKKFRTKTIVKH